MQISKPIIKHKTRLQNLAEELGNVSRIRKVMTVSRATFNAFKRLLKMVTLQR
jgi:hypothetical protein